MPEPNNTPIGCFGRQRKRKGRRSTDAYSWRGGGTDGSGRKIQVDLLLDRGDNMIDLCEIKFSGAEYELDAEESRKLAARVEVFRRATGTRKGVRTVLIASYGLAKGKYSGDVQSVVTLDDLFAGA